MLQESTNLYIVCRWNCCMDEIETSQRDILHCTL